LGLLFVVLVGGQGLAALQFSRFVDPIDEREVVPRLKKALLESMKGAVPAKSL